MKLRSLEALRGIAALSVVLAHASTMIISNQDLGIQSFHNGLEFYGMPGVEFFFVLSGFVMVESHRGRALSVANTWKFFYLRFLRIFPVLWICLIFRIYQLWGIPQVTFWNVVSWLTLNPLNDGDAIAVVWTLKMEIGFYFIFGLSMLPYFGRIVIPLWVMVAYFYVSGSDYLFLIPISPLASNFIYRLVLFSPTFLCGMFFGKLFSRINIKTSFAITVAGCGLIVAALRLSQESWGASYGPPYAQVIYGIGFGALILGCASVERSGALRLGRWTIVIGAISYPLYVSHIPVIDFTTTWINQLPGHWLAGQDQIFATFLVASVLVSLVLTVGFDRPVQWTVRRFMHRRSKAASP